MYSSLIGKLVLICRFVFIENFFIRKIAKNKFLNPILWEVYSKGFRNIVIVLFSRIGYSKFFEEDPFQVHWVKPDRVRRISSIPEEEFVYNIRYGRKIGGDWDQRGGRIEDMELYKAMDQYVEGLKWSNTELPDLFHEREKKWCEDQKSRKEELDKLLLNLKEEYKSQDELFVERPQETLKKCNDTVFPRLNEIQVSLGRDGELLWETNGQHRLVLAKLLDIEKIPVIIRCKHLES